MNDIEVDVKYLYVNLVRLIVNKSNSLVKYLVRREISLSLSKLFSNEWLSVQKGGSKNRFLESTTYNRWKSGLIPLEHHMHTFSPNGKAPIWALLR